MYGILTKEVTKLQDFPEIDAERYERELNRLFEHYIFYRQTKRAREYWTSCCGRHGQMKKETRTQTPGERELLIAGHNDLGVCPWCGERITYKCEGRLGKKKNLTEYQPAVILAAKDGDLYARAYWARKDYAVLNAAPSVFLVAAYRFSVREHSAMEYRHSYGGYLTTTMEGRYRVKERHISEPFYDNGWIGYPVMGQEEITKSDLKYCGWQENDYRAMKFFAIASLYPDKVEMLRKSGLGWIVQDLVVRGVKDSAFFNWEAENYKTAFKISRAELREAVALGLDGQGITHYMQQKKNLTLQDIADISRGLSWQTEAFYELCSQNKKHAKRAWKYLKKQTKPEIPGATPTARDTFQHWRDYLKMADDLGWDLTDETVAFPKDLVYSHDRAVEEMSARRKRQAEEAEMARQYRLKELERSRQKEIAKRQRKYNIEAAGYIIRVAETGEEILREGRTLRHCVGGYAERHLQGKTTILFMRRSETPEASLYTIEMQGNRMMQIHGYRNDIQAKTPPRQEMAWLLEPWMERRSSITVTDSISFAKSA